MSCCIPLDTDVIGGVDVDAACDAGAQERRAAQECEGE